MMLVLWASSAWAQGSGFVRGLGGITFGTETSSIIGGEAGFNIGSRLQLVVDVGRMQNVMPKEIKDQLDDFTRLFNIEFGVPLEVDVKIPAFYGSGGLRYTVPRSGAVSPFVEVSAGVARISADVHAELFGVDISRDVEDEAGLEPDNNFLFGLGGGIAVDMTESVGLDLGYRYHRIATDDPVVNASAAYVALRFNFR
jgi:opacity protein-like surface antigen